VHIRKAQLKQKEKNSESSRSFLYVKSLASCHIAKHQKLKHFENKLQVARQGGIIFIHF